MCSNPESESGDSQYMLQSGGKYYLWNPIEGAIAEIVTSMDLVDIITEMDKPRMGSLEFAKVYQMQTAGQKMLYTRETRNGLWDSAVRLEGP
jgi:hypothetical protein